MDGGDGNDFVDYSSFPDGIEIDLGSGFAILDNNTADLLRNIENILGGAGNDTISGSSIANILDGGLGNDFIVGNFGDLLLGGDGNDSLIGSSSTVSGGEGDDAIRNFGISFGDEGDDEIEGGGQMFGGAGRYTITATGSRDDLIFGDPETTP